MRYSFFSFFFEIKSSYELGEKKKSENIRPFMEGLFSRLFKDIPEIVCAKKIFCGIF